MKLEKFVWTGIAALVAMCIGTAPISAKPGGPKPATAKTTAVKPSTPKPTTMKTTTASHGTKSVQTPKVKSTTTTVKGTGTPKVKTTGGKAVATTKTAKATKTTTPGKSKTSTTSTTTTTTTNTTTTTGSGGTATTTELSKAQLKLQNNEKLMAKMTDRMKGILTGDQTVLQAASGFKNLGQFIAAVNVSNNLGIDFAELKARMTGLTIAGEPIQTTTPGTGTTEPKKLMSLGQAIQDVKGMDSTTATQTANTATTQANTEIASTSTTTTTTTTTTTSTTTNKTKKSKTNGNQ